MNMKILGGAEQGLNNAQGICNGPSREKAQTIIADMVKKHESELAAWNYLQLVTSEHPPDAVEEAALWEMLGRIRRERY